MGTSVQDNYWDQTQMSHKETNWSMVHLIEPAITYLKSSHPRIEFNSLLYEYTRSTAKLLYFKIILQTSLSLISSKFLTL